MVRDPEGGTGPERWYGTVRIQGAAPPGRPGLPVRSPAGTTGASSVTVTAKTYAAPGARSPGGPGATV